MATRFIIPALISTAVIGALAYSPTPDRIVDQKLTVKETVVDFGKPIEPPIPENENYDLPPAVFNAPPLPSLMAIQTVMIDQPGIRQYSPPVLTPNITGGPMVVTTGNPYGPGIRGSGGDRPTFNWADLENKPKTLFQAAPEYPASAKVKGVPGEVVVTFTVDEKGYVHNVQVVKSSSFEFEEPTVRAVSKWRFEPGRKNGRSVSFRMSVPVAFSINEEM